MLDKDELLDIIDKAYGLDVDTIKAVKWCEIADPVIREAWGQAVFSIEKLEDALYGCDQEPRVIGLGL